LAVVDSEIKVVDNLSKELAIKYAEDPGKKKKTTINKNISITNKTNKNKHKQKTNINKHKKQANTNINEKQT